VTPTITVADLKNRTGAQLIDVRSHSEFATGHIPGAVNIPMDQIEARTADFLPGAPLILICQSGKRARITAGLLEPCGRQISILDGGTNAWRQAGLPLVTNARTRWSLERQVRLAAGLLALTGAVLAFTINVNWLFLSAFIGAGLTFAGLTDLCPMVILLAVMPWNRRSHCHFSTPNAEPHDTVSPDTATRKLA